MSESIISFFGDPRLAVAAAGGLIGLLFGVLSESSQLCLLGGMREAREGRSNARLAAYAIAALISVAATQAFIAIGGADLSSAVYLSAASSIPGLVIGGLLFGFGAALTRGCAGRLTVLGASGNLRAVLVIVVLGLVAYATMRGVFAPLRLPLEAIAKPAAAAPDIVSGAGFAGTARLVIAAAAIIAALALARSAGMWRSLAATGIGLLVTAGWMASAILGDDGLEKLQPWSAAFVAPVANGLQYLLTFTGSKIDFGIAFAGGVILGAFVSSLVAGRFHLQSFESPRQTLRYLAGGALMGFGGILALGCTTGQGFAGISVLAPGSFAALAAIAAGMWLGLLYDSRLTSGNALPSGIASVKA